MELGYITIRYAIIMEIEMINFICGKYYDAPDDDFILFPTIVYANAKVKNRRSRAIALVWLTFGIGVVFHNKAAGEFLKLKRAAE